ncbi:MAG: SCO family protein [Ferruginibacter sp.]|nr:SCO family protein [Ferruginibacter sp.]
MKKSAVFGLLLALVLPFSGYFFVKYFSKDAAPMPRKYFEPDSVVVSTKNGKTSTDTIWHKVKNTNFVNQFNLPINLDSAKGKILVVNTIFTRCGGICPKITQVMKKMQDTYAKTDSLLQFISISVDPNFDSAHQLRKFADKYNVNHDNWWFLTGNKDELYHFMLKELKASIADTTVTPEFVHTDMFFLIDKNRVVRGFYHSLNEDNTTNDVAMGKLARDISLLSLEKDKTKPSIFRSFIPILPLIFIAIGIVFLVTLFLNKKRKTSNYATTISSKK